MAVLAMTRGDDRVIELAVTRADGTAQPLGGTTMRFTARRFATSEAAPELEKSVGAGITYTDAPNGLAEVAIDNEDTEELDGFTVMRWDAELSDGSIKRTVASGLLYVTPDVAPVSS